MKKAIKMLVLSDIHLGHNKNKTIDIITNLRRFFKTYRKEIITTNMIIISGDIYDRLLASNSSDFLLINKWLTEVVMFAKEYSIKVRILHGTPSHDWNQPMLAYKFIKGLNIDVDLKYYDILDIEYLEEYDINIMYLPDEWKPTSEEIYKDVKKKLLEYKLDKVDIAIMHGAFSFQLPDFIPHLLEPKDYLNITNGPIIIGHVHDHRVMSRIYVPGSFDALTHADDNKKGGLIINYDIKHKKITYKFLENKYRLRFKSINVVNKTIDEVRKQLVKINDNEIQYVRLLVNKDSTIGVNLKELINEFPFLNLSIKDKDKLNKKSVDVIHRNINKTLNKAIKLNKETIHQFVLDKLETDKVDIVLKHNIIKELDDIL